MTFHAVCYQATCSKCGETFCPADEADIVHLVREDGQECGGLGVDFGAWGVHDDTTMV